MQGRLNLIDVHPPGRNAFPGRSPRFSRGPPLGGKCAGGGFQVGCIPAQGFLAIIRTHQPRGPKFSLVSPPRGIGIWDLKSCSPSLCTGAPDHSGGSSAAAHAGENTPLSQRTELPPIPAYDLHLPATLRASAR